MRPPLWVSPFVFHDIPKPFWQFIHSNYTGFLTLLGPERFSVLVSWFMKIEDNHRVFSGVNRLSYLC